MTRQERKNLLCLARKDTGDESINRMIRGIVREKLAEDRKSRVS